MILESIRRDAARWRTSRCWFSPAVCLAQMTSSMTLSPNVTRTKRTQLGAGGVAALDGWCSSHPLLPYMLVLVCTWALFAASAHAERRRRPVRFSGARHGNWWPAFDACKEGDLGRRHLISQGSHISDRTLTKSKNWRRASGERIPSPAGLSIVGSGHCPLSGAGHPAVGDKTTDRPPNGRTWEGGGARRGQMLHLDEGNGWNASRLAC
ncbi:hypothetical protein HDV57DRAFT_337433 [Trichoderma longibrachiatum]